ncbi:MAG: hypothetical protein U1F67_07330 [Rubrivivax sp.]
MAAAAAASMPSLSSVSFRKPVLAWSIAAEDEERFRRITRRVLAVVLLLAVILPFVPKPELETQRAQELRGAAGAAAARTPGDTAGAAATAGGAGRKAAGRRDAAAEA